MPNQHNALQTMRLDEKGELLCQRVRLAIGNQVSGKVRRSARHYQPIVPRKLQTIDQEVVAVDAKASIAAIDRGRSNTSAVVGFERFEYPLFGLQIRIRLACVRDHRDEFITMSWRASCNSLVGAPVSDFW